VIYLTENIGTENTKKKNLLIRKNWDIMYQKTSHL